MEKMFKCLLLLTIFLVSIDKGTSIRCYKCKSKRDGTCGYPTDTNGVETDECPTPDSKCFQYEYNVDGHKSHEQFIERGCMIGSSTVCPSKPVESETIQYQCKMCQENKCNKDATTLKPIENGNGQGGGGNGNLNLISTSILFGITFLVLIKNNVLAGVM